MQNTPKIIIEELIDLHENNNEVNARVLYEAVMLRSAGIDFYDFVLATSELVSSGFIVENVINNITRFSIGDPINIVKYRLNNG